MTRRAIVLLRIMYAITHKLELVFLPRVVFLFICSGLTQMFVVGGNWLIRCPLYFPHSPYSEPVCFLVGHIRGRVCVTELIGTVEYLGVLYSRLR